MYSEGFDFVINALHVWPSDLWVPLEGCSSMAGHSSHFIEMLLHCSSSLGAKNPAGITTVFCQDVLE